MWEEMIIKKIQEWEKDLFVKLYDEYIKRIYNFVYYKVWDKVIAQDITSETFLKAYNNIFKFDISKQTKFSSWIFSIAHNLVIDHFRENSKKTDYSWLEDLSEQNDMLDNIENRDKLKNVLEFLNSLDEFKKQVFLMRIWDKLSYDEISGITWKTISNCKTTFSRTLKLVVDKFWVAALLLFII